LVRHFDFHQWQFIVAATASTTSTPPPMFGVRRGPVTALIFILSLVNGWTAANDLPFVVVRHRDSPGYSEKHVPPQHTKRPARPMDVSGAPGLNIQIVNGPAENRLFGHTVDGDGCEPAAGREFWTSGGGRGRRQR